MAAYVHQYVTAMLNAERSIKDKIGFGVMAAPTDMYRLNLMTLTLLGMVMKVVSTVAPQVTDAVWQDALTHAIDEGPGVGEQWPAWVLAQVDPDAL